MSELKLHVHSSFKHKMQVKSLTVVGDDPRFTFDTSKASKITPGHKSFVGTVKFDPGAGCDPEEECYTGFSPESKFGRPWYLGLAMPLNLGEMDLAVVHSLWNKMKALSSPSSIFNVSLKLDTSEVRGFLFSVRASLSWPVLSSSSVVKYPLTQLGNSTRRHLILTNPTTKPLLVHIVPMTSYPDASSVINLMPHRRIQGVPEILDPEDAAMFTIDSVTDVDNPDEPLETFGEDFLEKFGVEVSPATYPVILQPGQSAKVIVSFTPLEPAMPRTSVLFIRNNLTGVDLVNLVGSGAVGDIKFGNRKPGSVIHAFEVTEKHLKDCEKAATTKHILPNLTVKRPFTARNSGEVPIWVTGFEIDGKPCEGYGFKVLDCDPFQLAANDSKKINIAFTPDFTLSRITRTLTLKTSLGFRPGEGDVKYSLAATVPPQLLSLCSKALPRPYWEKMIYYGMLAILSATFCCAMVAAFFEADRILKFCFLMSSPAQQNFMAEHCKPFDLKEVARNAILESEKRIAAVEQENRNNSSKSPQHNMISENFVRMECMQTPSEVIDSLQDLKNKNDAANNTQTPKFSLIKKVASVVRFLFRTVYRPSEPSSPVAEAEKPKEKENDDSQQKEVVKEVKKVEVNGNSKKSPEVKKSKAGSKKQKQKITTQIAVNNTLSSQTSVKDDEVETSSTTTESSNAEDLSDSTLSKGITSNTINLSDTSVQSEPSKKNKKKQTKSKVEENIVVKEQQQPVKQKKKVEKQDSIKQEQKQQEKVKTVTKSSSESPKVTTQHQKIETPPPQQQQQQQQQQTKPKQEAKVKGVPKEVTELRRQQSAPAYDRPPRLQNNNNQQQVSSSRHESFAGNSQPETSFSSPPVTQKPEPPRAIILPEVKPNPGSQFGPIGRKVPTSGLGPSKTSWGGESAWSDSPAAAPPLQSRGMMNNGGTGSSVPPPTLLPPPGPGLTIMQQLQAERRQREEEYVRRQNNWPGFNDSTNTTSNGHMAGSTNYVENLWDTPQSSGHHLQTPQSPVVSSSSGAGLWGTLDNVWPSSVFNSGFNNDSLNINRENDNSLGINSLSLSSIWSSASPGHLQQPEPENENTWSSLFSENKKDI